MVGPILKGIGQPNRLAIVELVQSSLLIAVIWIGTDYVGVLATALAWLAAVGTSQSVSAAFLQKALPRPLAGLAGPMGAITVASAAGALLAFGVAAALPGLAGIAAAGLLGWAGTVLLFWLADRWLNLGLRRAFVRAFPQVASAIQRRPADSRPAEVL